MGKQRRHNELLHTWGIAYGLLVPDPPGGATRINITAGTAYDREGRELVLPEAMYLELEDEPEDDTIYVTISYQEVKTDPTDEAGVQGNTRWSEEPLVEPLDSQPTDQGLKLILARVERQGTAITSVDLSDRRYAGAIGGDLEVTSLTISGDGIDPQSWPVLRCEYPGRVDLTGDLRVTGNMLIEGNGDSACYIDYPTSFEFKRSGQRQMTIDRQGRTQMGFVFATGVRITPENTDSSPVIIDNCKDDEDTAREILENSENGTVIISGPLTMQLGPQTQSYLTFYWKDEEGNMFRGAVQGQSFI